MKNILLAICLFIPMFSLFGQRISGKVGWVKEGKATTPNTYPVSTAIVDHDNRLYAIIKGKNEVIMDGRVQSDSNWVAILTCHNEQGIELWRRNLKASAGWPHLWFAGVDSSNIYLYRTGGPFIFGSTTIPHISGITVISRDGNFQHNVSSSKQSYYLPQSLALPKTHGSQGVFTHLRPKGGGRHIGLLKASGKVDSVSEVYPSKVNWSAESLVMPNKNLLFGIDLHFDTLQFKNFSISPDTAFEHEFALVKLNVANGEFELKGILSGGSNLQMAVDPSSGNTIVSVVLQSDSVRWNGKALVGQGLYHRSVMLASIDQKGEVNWAKRTNNDPLKGRVWDIRGLSIFEGGVGRIAIEVDNGFGIDYDGISVKTGGHGLVLLNFDVDNGDGLFGMNALHGRNYGFHRAQVFFIDETRQYAYLNVSVGKPIKLGNTTYASDTDTTTSLLLLLDTVMNSSIEHTFSKDVKVMYSAESKTLTTVCSASGYEQHIYDMSGRLLLQAGNCSATQQTSLENVSPGLYIVALRDGDFHHSQKLLVR